MHSGIWYWKLILTVMRPSIYSCRNQIVLGIATNRYREGDVLPSVRQLADEIGINMHTVNKAYTVLKQEGFVKVDRRKGAVISVDEGKKKAMEEIRQELLLAAGKSELQEYFPSGGACFN